MITFNKGQILIDGKPTLLMMGEIHYYRLDPNQWQDRINRLKECGMNSVATYIPWVCHEITEGNIDIHGKTNPQLNLARFIELCEENDLYVFLRPGPFIMAEMKNDGIPYWVYEKCPEAIPVGFDGEMPTTPTLDYLSEGFLHAVKNWYKAVMGLIAEHVPNKGKVIAVQLDNEIGMLSWVSNKPTLTTDNINGFIKWLKERYKNNSELLEKRYPFALDKSSHKKFISPEEEYAVAFHFDFGLYNRKCFADYVNILKSYAQEFGVSDVLFVVNIHGTGGGRGFTYPIGVSQLLETVMADDDIITGSDVYFDNFEIRNFQDMYLCNEITKCVNPYGKPLTCVEFNSGDCNFGDDFSTRALASSGDFKTRLSVAQGNKLINHYLFCGGQNQRFENSLNDGNDRWATTGENHGFAAPIGPEGDLNHGYSRLARSLRNIMTLQDKFATSFIDYDSVAYGFIPDYYMTEYKYEKSEKTKCIYTNITESRNSNSWESTVRALLLHGVKMQVLDIQRQEINSNIKTLIVSSASYMDAELQKKILDFINNGGNVLMQGRIPIYDLEGNLCRILADALDVSDIEYYGKYQREYLPSIQGDGFLNGVREYHCNRFESMHVENAETILKVYATGKTCGFYKQIGKGKIVVITTQYKCYLEQYKKIMQALGIEQTLTHNITVPGYGVFMTNTVNDLGDGFVYIINMDDSDKDFDVCLRGENILGRNVHLPANEALTLPLNVTFDFGVVNYSSIEIIRVTNNSIVFRNTEKQSVISITTARELLNAEYISAVKDNSTYTINTDNRLLEDEVILKFSDI